ncbi:MAG: hypothetical protein HIU85_09495 [Proteobacteria bacterium]|nr:hypothetical protein [Pseudomonadota bacterium]
MASGTEILESAKEKAVSVAGGPARFQIIAVLAAILALEAADLGTVSAVAVAASVPILGFAIWTTSTLLGIGLLTIGAGVMSAAIAPIDAARLDIVHPRMWGRAEAGRMALRSTFEGGAPLLFGAMSGWLGGGQNGLMWTFLIMLIPMLLASFLGVSARKTYLRDVATAAASNRANKS